MTLDVDADRAGSERHSSPDAIVVEVSDLHYAYRGQEGRPVLRGIDLAVQRGEILGVAGRTGSGKSTLCYALTGIVPHSLGGTVRGSVRVAGVDVASASVAALTRHVSLVMQSPESQIVGLTVAEDVEFGLENLALDRDEIIARAAWALKAVRLDGFEQASPWTLSGGQKQRLAIAAAIAFRPEVLVLDNPTAELDPLGKREVLETLVRLNAELGTTLIVVNQELHEMVPHATRLALLDSGRIAAIAAPADVLDDADLVRSAGLRLPEVSEIAARLRERGRWPGRLPTDVAEASSALATLLPERPRRVASRRPVRTEQATADPDETDAIVRFDAVSFAYPKGHLVLDGISLRIGRGEFVALMGPNGAGKTTLAKHVNGLLHPTHGEVRVNGQKIRSRSVAQLASSVGYVFQNPDHQVFSETVTRELAFGPHNLGWSQARIDDAVDRMLDELGLRAHADAEPFFLGLAERKLLALGSTLVMDPDVLVLDEPATGADHATAQRIMRRIDELNRGGLTVLIITHDVLLAAEYAKRLIVIRDGRIVLDGPPAQVFRQREELEDAFIVPPQTAELASSLAGRVPEDLISVSEFVAAVEAA